MSPGFHAYAAFYGYNNRMDANGIEAKKSRYGSNMPHNGSSLLASVLDSAASRLIADATEEHDDDASALSKFGRPLLTIAAVSSIMIMVVGIFGNLLTIVALLKCPKVRNVAAAFIISLCVGDLLFCVLVLPFNVTRFIAGKWVHGDVLCHLVPFVQYGSVGVSLLFIAMITINRYIMITHHSAYARIYKKHWIAAMISFCWLFSYGVQLPTLFGVWGKFGYDPNLGTCSILKDNKGNSSKISLFVIAFLIPCLIIIYCYTHIFWVVRESELRMRKHASKQNNIPNNLRPMPPTSTGNNLPVTSNNDAIASSSQQRLSSQSNMSSDDVGIDVAPVPADSIAGTTNARPGAVLHQKITRIKDHREAKVRRNEWRITKMVLAIFLSFVACYLPITLAKIVDPNVNSPTLHVIGYLMLYMSACINPIIYVIMNKQYRQAYKTVITCKNGRLLSFAGSSVGEKWKDIGFSYNHSRTMVSQVSIADESPSEASVPVAALAAQSPADHSRSSRTSLTHRDSMLRSSRLPVIPDSNELHI